MSVSLSPPGVGRAFAALWALTAFGAAVAVAVPGLASNLRGWFAFEPGAPGQLAAVWVANLRVAGFVLLTALAHAARWPVWLLDSLVAVVLSTNVVLVGLAIGAHGPELAPWLAHLPFEWAGFAVALAAYLSARRDPSSLRRLLSAAGLSAGLLALAAALEVWATPLPWL